MASRKAPFVSGNHFDKYATKNVALKFLHDRFIGSARRLADAVAPDRVIEVGCGPGELASCLFGAPRWRPAIYVGTDVSEEEVLAARSKLPGWDFQVASIYDLPFPDGSFDLVVACEVFEHLDDPAAALDEVARVCGGHLLASVPWEPVWCLANFCRGKYLASLGNTPGHLQHFSRRDFRRLIRRRFDILDEARPFPWTMCLAAVRPAGT